MATVPRSTGPDSRDRRRVSVRRVAEAMRDAARGLGWAWQEQPNLRLEVLIGTLAVAAAVVLEAALAPILLACGLVLSAELLNSAVEAVVDRLAPERHPVAGRAKDIGAAAVLVASAIAVLVGLAVLGPPLLRGLIAGGTA